MDVVMPQLGETVREGTISVWHKRVGDAVRPDESLFEVETDKVTVDVPAPAAGVLAEILVPVGGQALVGARLAVIRVAGEAEAAVAGGAAAPAAVAGGAAAPAAVAGGAVAPAAASASAAPTARAAAAVAGAAPLVASAAPTARGAANPAGASSELRLSPVVRKLLAEHDIADPTVIPGTGADGRITRDDVLAYVERRSAAPAPPDADTVVAMTRIRKRTAEHMVQSVATSPHVLQAVEVDFHAVERLRAAAGDAWRSREGFSLSYLPFVARAVCRAIPEFPHVNASVRGDSLVVHHRVHLGIAVDLDRQGLIVPVIKDCAGKTVRALAVAIHQLADRARRGALAPDDLTEGTYTLSNSGPFGTLLTAPIIHQPQVAILSTDGVRKRPVVIESPAGDAIAIRPVGVLAQCFDHRAFDGAYSAAFLGRVREILEQGQFADELA